MFWSRRGENRKWQHRPQLYRGRFYYLKRAGQALLFLSLAGALSGFVLYIRYSDALGIRTVEVLGELTHLDRDGVIVLSGIRKTDKLFTVNLERIQQNILAFPWVRAVSVRREFPATIQIHVTERKPLAQLLAGGRYLIDENGVVFKKWEPGDPSDLPVITGFSREEIERYPLLTRNFLMRTVAFLKYLHKWDFYKEYAISEVHFDSVFGFTVYTQREGLEIYYGRDDFARKQQKLEKFKLSKAFSKISFVRLDLDSQDRVVARYDKKR